MTVLLNEDAAEELCLGWLEDLGYTKLHGPDISPGGDSQERDSYFDVVLRGRLEGALQSINPGQSFSILEEAARRLILLSSASLIDANREFHDLLLNGVPIETTRSDGTTAHELVKIVDFDNPDNNDWAAVKQFTVKEGEYQRRTDVILFINGLPLVVIELKNPTDEKASLHSAYQQLQTYKNELPKLFTYNELCVTSDLYNARLGALTSPEERFMRWRNMNGQGKEKKVSMELETLVHGVFRKERVLDLIQNFIAFKDDGKERIKILAAYHQVHAVNAALEAALEATGHDGDRQGGVVWHTQGSGKSFTMTFFAGKAVKSQALKNPTIVILTDRNDLDDQLYGTFCDCESLLRQTPQQAADRADLKQKLSVASGGVIFTTVQKFMPEEKGDEYPLLTDRRNVIVMADEAHRSQYDFIDGYAKNMRDALPNATFVGFTGTPIEFTDKNTRAVFGDYISIYDIQRAVEDGATVPIYYESRLAKVEISENLKDVLDERFEEVTEGEEESAKERGKSRWTQLEAIVGSENRIQLIAEDIVEHFEQRQKVMQGKAMIVGMSRRICVALHDAIIKLRPDWYSPDDNKGQIKVVMTGSAQDTDWQEHIRTKKRRKELANRMKDPKDPLQLVIVRDMWLTGFDAPSTHTMYVDKPMSGHNLMQAIARVNRVYKEKPGGLVVDYIGLQNELKQALNTYTDSGGKGSTALDKEKAVEVMEKEHEICSQLLHGFDWTPFFQSDAAAQYKVILEAMEIVLEQKDGKKRFLDHSLAFSKAHALSVPHPKALALNNDLVFFQHLKGALSKNSADPTPGKTRADIDLAVRQLVSEAVASDEVVDIFDAAGLDKPEISILSEDFMNEVRHMKHKNVAVELLRRLLNSEIKARAKSNLVQSRSFADMLERSIRKYQNRAIEAAQVIEELIALAKDMEERRKKGEELGLNNDELAFYEALAQNDSAKEVMGDEKLCVIAHDLLETIRKNVTIDWTLKESARAHIRRLVKRVLREFGYPPDMQAEAVKLVLQQAELMADSWAS